MTPPDDRQAPATGMGGCSIRCRRRSSSATTTSSGFAASGARRLRITPSFSRGPISTWCWGPTPLVPATSNWYGATATYPTASTRWAAGCSRSGSRGTSMTAPPSSSTSSTGASPRSPGCVSGWASAFRRAFRPTCISRRRMHRDSTRTGTRTMSSCCRSAERSAGSSTTPRSGCRSGASASGAAYLPARSARSSNWALATSSISHAASCMRRARRVNRRSTSRSA